MYVERWRGDDESEFTSYWVIGLRQELIRLYATWLRAYVLLCFVAEGSDAEREKSIFLFYSNLYIYLFGFCCRLCCRKMSDSFPTLPYYTNTICTDQWGSTIKLNLNLPVKSKTLSRKVC